MANRVFNAFLIIILIITSIFLITPLLMLVKEGANSIAPSLASEEVVFAIKLSLKTTAIATVICIFLAIPVSYKLYTGSSRIQNVLTNVLYLPMSLPHLVSGMALLLLFGRRGIGEFLYNTLHIDFIFTQSGIVLALVFVNLPFAINMVLTAMEGSNRKNGLHRQDARLQRGADFFSRDAADAPPHDHLNGRHDLVEGARRVRRRHHGGGHDEAEDGDPPDGHLSEHGDGRSGPRGGRFRYPHHHIARLPADF